MKSNRSSLGDDMIDLQGGEISYGGGTDLSFAELFSKPPINDCIKLRIEHIHLGR